MLMLQAINTHDIATLKKLINDGLDINEVFTFPITFGAEIGKEIQITYLSLALSHHDKEVAAMLLNAGANPNTLIKNTEGNLVTARGQLFSLKEKTICNIDATIAFLDDYLQKKSN